MALRLTARRGAGGRPNPAVLVLLSLLLLSAACNREDSPTITVDDQGTTSSSPSSTSTTAFEPTPLPASGPATKARGYLKDVRVAAQPGFDRVVFEFEDALPGYEVSRVEPPVHEDGSGDEVNVRGEELLQVRFDNAATARIEGEKVVPVYTGPEHVQGGGTDVVVEVVDAGDFEGTVRWVVGLKEARSVRVSTLASPHRLVVDVAAS
jgi:hypothetical protein